MTNLSGTNLNSFSWPEGWRAGDRNKITQDVRDYAAKLGVDEQEALKAGMKSKSVEFREKGAEVYLKN